MIHTQKGDNELENTKKKEIIIDKQYPHRSSDGEREREKILEI